MTTRTRIEELTIQLDRCVRFLADLNGCEWIKGGDVGSVDMRQRAKALQQTAFAALAIPVAEKYSGEKRDRLIKGLRDAIPQGDHPNPDSEYITVRLDFVMKAANAIEAFDDDKDWLEHGVAEWRHLAKSHGRQAEAARATARVSIGHLQSVLNSSRTHSEQQQADTMARDWLISIGSEPS